MGKARGPRNNPETGFRGSPTTHPTAPPTPPASRGRTCEYVSIVSVIDACPSICSIPRKSHNFLDQLRGSLQAAALIDRLLHHCHIVNIRGNSYRMRKHTDLSKILHSPPAEPSPSPPRRKESKSKGEVDDLEARHLRRVCNFQWPLL